MAKTVPQAGPRAAVAPKIADVFVEGAKKDQTPKATKTSKRSKAPKAPKALRASATTPLGRALVLRKNGGPVRRLVAYFPPELARSLAHWCADNDKDTSSAIVEAVRRMVAK